MQFGIDLKNFITEKIEMIISQLSVIVCLVLKYVSSTEMFFPGLNVYPGTIIEATPKPEISEEIGEWCQDSEPFWCFISPYYRIAAENKAVGCFE